MQAYDASLGGNQEAPAQAQAAQGSRSVMDKAMLGFFNTVAGGLDAVAKAAGIGKYSKTPNTRPIWDPSKSDLANDLAGAFRDPSYVPDPSETYSGEEAISEAPGGGVPPSMNPELNRKALQDNTTAVALGTKIGRAHV